MMPVDAGGIAHAKALGAAGPFHAFGLASATGCRLLAAESPLGPWYAS